MSGTIAFDLPTYTMAGQQITLYSTGVTSPKNIVYYWTSKTIELVEDTVKGQSITIKIPEASGKYSITAFATSDGYYNSTTVKTTIAINPNSGESIEGLKRGVDIVIDQRDREKYYYKKIGKLFWFTDNLRYAGTPDNVLGAAYEKSDAIGLLFGRLYSWNDATGGKSGSGLGGGPQGACPEGWSVPTKEDWEDFGTALNDNNPVDYFNKWNGLASPATAPAIFNGDKMWPYSPSLDPNNHLWWNGIPCGNSKDNYSTYQNIMQYGMWWSSMDTPDASKGSYRYIYYNSPNFDYHYADKDEFGVSVRCVKLAN